ncbi:MAG: DUF2135 domain-containing protein [Chryseobacterium sp.]|jgi:hypothetical protein|uniref:VIT domain-containing protein n=1 Tax=Chryseobacterium sp. TaxID=1871047 RepID=UPI002823B478|nr:VIT domain-containing protein [Chryseobacterium sp.]MDR2238690.1 DUF2135 domain-containing protein [Chryseobacterium sp.]
MKNIWISILILCIPVVLYAQVPTIETPDEKGGFEKNTKVILQKIDIETKITGRISTNTVTMVFKNNAPRLMEGRLTFPLPEGVSVSGYALDIEGKLRKAVPVEKEKAKQVFETIQKKNIDPGILEKVEGNNFRTRIYPIAANGGERTVQITYHYELKRTGNDYQYFLPLNFSSPIPEFNIKTIVYQNAVTPQLEEKPDGSFSFVKNGNSWIAETHKQNYKPGQNLKINIPQENAAQNILIGKGQDQSAYFLAAMAIDPKERAKKQPGKLAVVWDNSLSGLKRNHEKEWELLEEYFRINKNLSVKVYFLSNTFEEGNTFTIENGNWKSLKNYLSGTVYDGGTDFGQLKTVNEDEVLLFSDGMSTFGDRNFNGKKPVFTISSSNTANFGQLKYISSITGGEFLNLNENDPKKEVRKLLFQPLKFLRIEDNNSVTQVYPSLTQTISQDFVLTGIVKTNQTSVKVLFGYGNEVTETRVLQLNVDTQSVKDWDISQFWAQKKLNELEIFEKENSEDIKEISRKYGLASHNMSLMVLEEISDYVKYKILPPSELRAEYDRIIKENKEEKDWLVNDIMEDAEVTIENLKKWWQTDFQHKKKKKNRAAKTMRGVVPEPAHAPTPASTPVSAEYAMEVKRSDETAASNAVVTQHLEGRAERVREASGSRTDTIKMIEEMVVTGFGIRKAGKITVVDVKSDADYMKFFTSAKKPAEIYQIYLQHRKDYIETPQYYFDIAGLLFKSNDQKSGLKVLSSVADLDIENEELYKLLAYKLKQVGAYDKELWITGKILELRPFDPQSYRDYALALEDNSRYQEALNNLYKVLIQSYTSEQNRRDEGIEEIILMEINQLISRHRDKLDLKGINPRLIADLPVNIRVVINWNKDNTDIDLWVTGPDKEKCMYSHSETEAGGRLSNDFTEGFGPEQFLLKKAAKGKYIIETNFYGETQVNIAGPTAIMAEIYLNYATGKQERKTVVFQNQKKGKNDQKEGILIGEFEF